MKIEVEIPDDMVLDNDGQELNLYLFAGMNHIAVRRPDSKWVVKATKCSMCGTCCTGTHIRGMKLPLKDGKCVFLKTTKTGKRICSWGANRPFTCCIGAPKWEPNCTLTWKVAE